MFKEIFLEGSQDSQDSQASKREAIEKIVSQFKVYKKSGPNAKSGSNYDYVFRGPGSGHYVSVNAMISLLMGEKIRTLGVGKDYLMTRIKRKYPKLYKELLELEKDQ